MANITITEALAEIKTVDKRIEKKKAFVTDYLYRSEGLKDPHEKDGGSVKLIAAERQSIKDLEDRVISLRTGIQKANDTTKVTIEGTERTISEWLIWKREVAPKEGLFFHEVNTKLRSIRDNARRQGWNTLAADGKAEKPTDVIININENEFSKEHEKLVNTLGILDAQLSLKNATVTIAA